jgi:hypothetical protein
VNDYSFEGTRYESIISFEHLFYRLGMRNREWIRIDQLFALAAVGVWVTYQTLRRNMPRPPASALVGLCSLLVLYHRDYDKVILAVPLVYCAGRVPETAGRPRCLFSTCGALVLAVLFMNSVVLNFLTRRSTHWGVWSGVVQATLLPYPIWLILIAMVLLARAASIDRTCLADASVS